MKNVREVLEEFEGRMNTEVRRQEKIDMVEVKDFRRGELPGKVSLYFTFYFYFYFVLFFYFLFLEQLGLGWIGHAVTSVTI